MSDDLKPCPFCGGEINGICKTDYCGGDAYAVSCRYKGCHGSIFTLGYGYFATKEEAIAAWNTRREFAPVVIHQVDPSAIREAAWVEALDTAHEYTLTQYGMGFLKHPVDRERILALIGEKK